MQANSIHCKSCLCWQEPPRIYREPPDRNRPTASRVRSSSSDRSLEHSISRQRCIQIKPQGMRAHRALPVPMTVPKPRCAYAAAAVWGAEPIKNHQLWQSLPWQIRIRFVHANTLDLRVGNAAPRGNDFGNLDVVGRMKKKNKSNKFSYLGFAQKVQQSMAQPMSSGHSDRSHEWTIGTSAQKINEKAAKKVYFQKDVTSS